MKRWPAITALGVTAWPVAFLIGSGFVASVESWKWGSWNSCASRTLPETSGSTPGEVVSAHCLTPVTAVTPGLALQFAGIAVLMAGLWWTGWLLQMRYTRKLDGRPPTLPASSLLLALWFLGAMAFCTAWAAQHHTFM
jgi:hypothetical protein